MEVKWGQVDLVYHCVSVSAGHKAKVGEDLTHCVPMQEMS